MDRSLMAPLIAEYDRNMEEMAGQLQYYQAQMGEMKMKLETIIKENERLHVELRQSVEKQLESLPTTGVSSDVITEEGIIKNLEEQVLLASQEKEQALEMWQTVAQELDRLQRVYQEHMTDAQIHVAERQKQKEQLASCQQLTEQLQMTKERLESANQHFLKVATEQNVELEQLRKQLRQTKLDLRTAFMKVEDMTKLMQSLQEEMHIKEEDAKTAQGREEASDKRLQQLRSAVTQLETRLRVAAQDAEQLRKEKSGLEKQVGELQRKYAILEDEKFEAVEKVRDSIQLLEEANLQKDLALLREKQKENEVEKIKDAISQLIQDAAVRTRKEVENVRKQSNVQISRLAEELSTLQMECDDKQGQIERLMREKRAVEEELEKLYREGRGNEGSHRKMDELHQRCLNAERAKDDLQFSLQATQAKIKKLEMNYEEEMSRCQERILKLQNAVDSTREDCGTICEERLKLQQENEQLHKEMEDLRKSTLEAQRKAKLQVSIVEHEHSLKEHAFEARLRELEKNNQSSVEELRRLLMAQQKATNKWRDEAKKLTEGFEAKLNTLKTELSQKKLHVQELLSQLQADSDKVAEYEKLMLEYQEKTNRLQRRLTESEQRAANTSQQLSKITIQRRKAASLADLENI